MARIVLVLLVLALGGAAGAATFADGSDAAAAATPIQRTFVSTSGNDANPCTRTEPCRNVQAALPNTLPGGEVIALDSGGYGAFTVDKSVSVIGAPGVHAAITAFSGNGVTVSAGSTDTVVLRNLYITGLGGDNGIRFFTGGALHVEAVTVSGFVNRGIRATSEGATSKLIIRDSVFRHCNGGVIANGTNGDLSVQIERTRADLNSNHGFWFLGPVHGSVEGSTAVGNAGAGFFLQPEAALTIADSRAERNLDGFAMQTPSTGGIVLMLDRVVSSNNSANGVFASQNSVARITASTVTGNGVGLLNSLGTLETFGDNVVRGNATNTSGTVTQVAKT